MSPHGEGISWIPLAVFFNPGLADMRLESSLDRGNQLLEIEKKEIKH